MRTITEEITETIDGCDIAVTKQIVGGPHIKRIPSIRITRTTGFTVVNRLNFTREPRKVAETFRRIADWLESIA